MNNAYRIIGDFHTHTIASQHAYSTIYENLVAAKRQGLVALAITDHGPEMMDGAIRHHFFCMTGLPQNPEGIRLYRGCEANIKSFSGRLDLDDRVLGRLEWVIASYHVEAIEPGTVEQNTEGWLSVIANQWVDLLGHPGNPAYPFDHVAVVKALRDTGKALEINANSFAIRPGSEPNCRDLMRLCRQYDVPVCVDSDAHNLWAVGNVKAALDILEDEQFPPELILNADFNRIDSYIERRKKEKGIDRKYH